MTTYTARATRESGWWTVEVDEVPGLFTQARRLDQIPGEIKDALSLFPELDPDIANAEIHVVVTGEYGELSLSVAQAKEEAQRAHNEAQELSRSVARELYEDGLPYRDIGQLLGISFQRAQTLVTQ